MQKVTENLTTKLFLSCMVSFLAVIGKEGGVILCGVHVSIHFVPDLLSCPFYT